MKTPSMHHSFTLLIGLWLASPAFAIQVNLDTPRLETTLKPGQSKRLRIKLINYEEMPVRMKVYLQDLRILPDGSPDFIEPGSTAWSLKNFSIDIPPAFALGGRSSRTIGFRVAIPENAQGGHYGALIFESEPTKSRAKSGGNININIRLASLILIRVKGTEVVAAKIKELKAWHENGKAIIRLSVINEGNVYIKPQGQLRLSKGSAAILSKDVNPSKFAVMPGETKEYLSEWTDKDLPAGPLDVVSEIDFGGKEILGAKTSLE